MGRASESVHHQHSVALLIIDMMNTLEFPEGRDLLNQALPAARAILGLKSRAKKAGIPVVYVNDNFGKWRSSWEEVFELCAHKDSMGKELAELLKPDHEDYFVLKPKHSGFYSTTLEVLLGALGAKTLVLTGVAGNLCVLFTANDAHMREYSVVVPSDCVASNSETDNRTALDQLGRVLGIPTTPSQELDLGRLA